MGTNHAFNPRLSNRPKVKSMKLLRSAKKGQRYIHRRSRCTKKDRDKNTQTNKKQINRRWRKKGEVLLEIIISIYLFTFVTI